MKKRNLKPPMLTSLMLLTLLCGWLPAGAYDFMAGGLCYNINSDGTSVAVTYQNSLPAYSSLSGAVTIPPTVTNAGKTYSVTAIGKRAFYFCSGLTSVTIPNSVTEIGESSFYGCYGLTSVTIPNSVAYIGYKAFSDCIGLTSINVEIHNIKYDSRNNCNAIIETDSNVLICGCKNTNIPNSVTTIGDAAFFSCIGLTSVNIPYSVTSIGKSAFFECLGLTSMTIPNSVTSIGEKAFTNCLGLTSVTIGNSVTSIGVGAFGYCSGLTSVTIPNSVSSIGDYAFIRCIGLTSVTIPGSVTEIGVNPFSSCSGLTSISVSPSNINYDSRENCNAIIETSTDKLIAGCQNTTIPNSVTEIGNEAFRGCSGLTSMDIGNSIISIGDYAFYDCSSLTSVTFGDSLLKIGMAAFFETPWFDNLPDGLNYAGLLAFRYKGTMPDGTNIVLKEGTTGIANDCFFDYSGLTSVTIPSSVASIGDDAFYGCNSLMDFYSEPRCADITMGGWVFGGDAAANATLHVKPSQVNAYKAADQWKDFSKIVGDIDDAGSKPFDVNNDENIDVGDVNAILEAILAGNNDAKFNVNGDTGVDIGDVNAVLEYILNHSAAAMLHP